LLLRLHLAQADAIDVAIAEIDRDLGERLEPFRDAVQWVSTTPGMAELSATAILSEIGVDMSRFPEPRASHLLGRAVPAK
jgi:transposase